MPKAPPSTERGERSRRAIIDAARPIFAREGYAAASLNQIIEASGLTKGGFYFHYPSKQALALSVVADHHERWIGRVRDDISPDVLAQVAVGGFTGIQVISEQLGDGRFTERVEALIKVVQLATVQPRKGGRRE